jgi:hypothetical protein
VGLYVIGAGHGTHGDRMAGASIIRPVAAKRAFDPGELLSISGPDCWERRFTPRPVAAALADRIRASEVKYQSVVDAMGVRPDADR